MKCEEAVQFFLKQEDNKLPLLLKLHMMFCPGCRKEIHELQGIFSGALGNPPFIMARDMSESVMSTIALSELNREIDFSPLRWLLVGLTIFASIFLISYSDSFIWMKEHFGSGLEIPLNLVLGIAITCYAVFYIGTHLESAKKLAGIIIDKIH